MDATNVTTGVRTSLGGVYRAPLGTALPTDATTTLNEAFKDMGYISEDGITIARSVESQDIKEWGGATVQVVQTSKDVTVAMKAIEALNVDTIKAVYGAENVTGTLATGLTVTENDDEPEEASWVIEMITNSGANSRVVIPRGKISELGDEVYKRDEAVGYDMTIACLPDATGAKMYKYIKNA